MSKLEQITKLIDAGYNKAEIAELLFEAQPEEPTTDKQPEQTESKSEPTPVQDESINKIDEAIARIDKLAESMAKMAILNSQQPARETTDDFLAKIINPYYKEEN